MIGFERPLLLLATIPAFAWLAMIAGGRASALAILPGGWTQAVDPGLQALQAGRMPPSRRHTIRYALAASWVLIAVAMAGPVIERDAPEPAANLAGRAIVLDLGAGVDPGALHLAADALLAGPDVPTAIIAATSDTYTAVPLTTDRRQIDRYLNVLTPAIMPTAGQSVATALAHADTMLDKAGVLVGQAVLITGGPAPTTQPDAEPPRHLRSMIAVGPGTGGWETIAEAVNATLHAPSGTGEVNTALQAALDEAMQNQHGPHRMDLAPVFMALAMLGWLTLFRREHMA